VIKNLVHLIKSLNTSGITMVHVPLTW